MEPEVTATARTTSGFVQRCVVALSAGAPSSGWQPLTDPRSAAEPRLNAWLAAVLGPPARWRFSGRVVGPDGAIGPTARIKTCIHKAGGCERGAEGNDNEKSSSEKSG